MKLLCGKHKTELKELFCDSCYQDRVKAFQIAFKGQQVTMGISGIPESIDSTEGQTGLLPKHEMAYLEFYLPASVYVDACNFIEKRMAAFTNSCPCASCLLKRAEKQCTPPTL